MRRILAAGSVGLVGLVAWASVLSAQVAIPVIPPGAAYTVTWTQDLSYGPSFRLWIDGKIVTNYKASDVTCTPTTAPLATCSAPGVPFTSGQMGTHTIVLSAFNAVGEMKSPALTVTVRWPAPPHAPTDVGVELRE